MRALEYMERVLASPTLLLLHEAERNAEIISRLLPGGAPRGARAHDARIVALCLEHGVAELVMADRDFRRFVEPRVTDPFAA